MPFYTPPSTSSPITTAGDILVGGNAGLPSRLPIGTDGQILTATSGSPVWQTPNTAFGNTYASAIRSSNPVSVSPNAFTNVSFFTEESDVGDNLNPATWFYTVPSSGVYQATGTFRVADASPAGVNFGVGFNSSTGDGPWFLWHAVQTTNNTSRRTTYPYTRVAYFPAGAQLRMFCYFDHTVAVSYETVSMQIIRIA